ncbi:YqgE/AlgH family protein, partial [Bacteroides xylanisolvens]
MNIDSDIFKIQSNNVLPSRGKILISEPFLRDATFGRSVILLVDHTDEGSMGLVINKQLPLFLNDIIMEFKYLDEIPLYKGGPIATDTLFYLHTLSDIPGSISISKGLYLNGDFDEIKKY